MSQVICAQFMTILFHINSTGIILIKDITCQIVILFSQEIFCPYCMWQVITDAHDFRFCRTLCIEFLFTTIVDYCPFTQTGHLSRVIWLLYGGIVLRQSCQPDPSWNQHLHRINCLSLEWELFLVFHSHIWLHTHLFTLPSTTLQSHYLEI